MTTIPEALATAARRGRGALVFHLADGPVALGIEELAERAHAAAGALAVRGVGPGDRVGLLGRNRPEWAIWAYGTWLAGAALVPVQIPIRVRDAAAFVERVGALVRTADVALVVAEPDLAFAVADGPVLAWDAPVRTRGGEVAAVRPEDPAVIQFTSGSTSEPKGAVLSHAAVLAQVGQLAERFRPDPADEIVAGWAPFFHDLGLFLYVTMPPLVGASCHLLPTERFARDPAEWLRMVGRTEATLTAAPQSAWAAALKAARRRPEERLDLSSLEMALFAAEPVDPDLLDDIAAATRTAGLAPGAIGSTYGLAEAVMGATTTLRGQGLPVDAVDRTVLAAEGLAVAPRAAERRVVSCGPAMAGMEFRVAGEHGELPDGQVGAVQLRGPSIMSGYLGESAAQPFVDGWLQTGDLGYRREGALFVTGRAKDLIIVMGHNHYPEDLEWAASRVDGVREGRSAAFVTSAGDGIVLLVEPRGEPDPAALARSVRNAVADAVGTDPADVVVVPPGTILKTTSGKVRRSAIREAYERGKLTG